MIPRNELIEYLKSQNCEVVRTAKQGYTVVRNKDNRKISGIPANDPLETATACRICITLEVDLPTCEQQHSSVMAELFMKISELIKKNND